MAEDGFWKEVLDVFFEDFMALFFPQEHAGIDWKVGFNVRDKELSKLNRDNETGTRFVDKLIEVRRLDGDQALVLVHVEIQSRADSDFSRRMWTYHYRIIDRYRCGVASLALLADSDVSWRPGIYGHKLWGCELTFRYPTAKLLDFQVRADELRSSKNPFALLTLALLKAQETANDMSERGRWKLQAMRSLYRFGASRKETRQLLKFMDWAVRLPEELDRQLHTLLANSEEDKKMAYVTSFERIGLERGMEKGLKQGLEKGMKQGLEQGLEQGRLQVAQENILDVLVLRFGSVPQSVQNTVTAQKDIALCKELHRASIRTATVAEFAALLEQWVKR